MSADARPHRPAAPNPAVVPTGPEATALANAATAALVVDELVRCGVHSFFAAPGSRSAPLVIAAARHPEVALTMVLDERVAAFAALGYGRASGAPAVVLTTSGTAIAHALPAILEADADAVPLLAISADRPPEARATFANQTLDQVHLFGRHLRAFVDWPCPDAALPPAYWRSDVDRLVAAALGQPPGPVHINAMFRKPLEPPPGAPAELWQALWPAAAAAMPAGGPQAQTFGAALGLDAAAAAALALRLDVAGNDGLLLVGGLRSGADRDAARALAAALGWPVLADVASGLRLDAGTPHLCGHLELALADAAFAAALRPACVLEVGGAVVSGRVAAWLEHVRPARIAVRADPRRRDPEHGQALRIQAALPALAAFVAQHRAVPAATAATSAPTWADRFADLDRRIAAALAAAPTLDGAAAAITDEVQIARAVTRALPSGAALMAASSMPIRDLDAWATPRAAPPSVHANRGASGIDGLVATALGLASGAGGPVALLVGDLALLHDLGGLAALAQSDVPVTVVAIDNGGGGIFSFLPIATHADVFERCFATPQTLDLAAIASAFGLPVAAPTTIGALEDAVAAGAGRGRPSLVLLRTDRRHNREAHAALLADLVLPAVAAWRAAAATPC